LLEKWQRHSQEEGVQGRKSGLSQKSNREACLAAQKTACVSNRRGRRRGGEDDTSKDSPSRRTKGRRQIGSEERLEERGNDSTGMCAMEGTA